MEQNTSTCVMFQFFTQQQSMNCKNKDPTGYKAHIIDTQTQTKSAQVKQLHKMVQK